MLEWGRDDAFLDHTVILIHGLLDLSWGWASTVESGLARQFHVVAPDLRGHGDSDRVGLGGYYHFVDYLADLHSLIDLVGRDRVSLVGHSMGGSIASNYAGAYPQSIHRLALLEGIGMVEIPMKSPGTIAGWIAAWKRVSERERTKYSSLRDAATRLRRNDPQLSDEVALELAEKATLEIDGGGRRFKHDPLLATFGPHPFKFDDAKQFWQAIKCPVLLVEGEKSVLRHSDEEKERRHNCFADRRVEIVSHAGHMIQRHEPAALAKLLADFLGR